MLSPKLFEQMNFNIIKEQYRHRTSIWRILADIISLAILLAVALIIHNVAKPFTRGFFCADTSIQYPFKENTVPTYAVILLSIFLPLLWMWITEICKRVYFAVSSKPMMEIRLDITGTRSIFISPLVRNIYILTVIFFYGYLATVILTEIAKNFVGALRPHFRAVCQPTFNCSAVTSFGEFYRYLEYGTDYTCQNTDESAVREARRSFFSGHASSIFYGFSWLIMYIHLSWSWRNLGILGHLFQVGIAILAFYIGYSRITDFQHHWYDALMGAIAGSLIAFVSFKFILNWITYKKHFLPYTIHQALSTDNQYSGINTSQRFMSLPLRHRQWRF